MAVSGPTWGSRQGRLSRQDLEELAELFEGFEGFESIYPPPQGVEDDRRYLIVYGVKVVRASAASETLPAALRAIIERLEQLAMAVEPR